MQAEMCIDQQKSGSLLDYNQNWNVLIYFNKTYQYQIFMTICLVVPNLLYADQQTL
jgi:hypothetical protein